MVTKSAKGSHFAPAYVLDWHFRHVVESIALPFGTAMLVLRYRM